MKKKIILVTLGLTIDSLSYSWFIPQDKRMILPILPGKP